MVPPESACLLGADPGRQGQDDVRAGPVLRGRLEYGDGLVVGQRPRRPALLPWRRPDEGCHIAAHQIAGLSVPDGPLQRVVRQGHRSRGARRGNRLQRGLHVGGRQLAERPAADRVDHGLERVAVHRDRLLRPPAEPLGKPGSYGIRDRVRGLWGNPRVQILAKRTDLSSRLSLRAARYCLAEPLPAGTGSKRHDSAPPAGTVPMILRVAARSMVLEMNRRLALAALHMGDATMRRTRWLPKLAPDLGSQDLNVPLTWWSYGDSNPRPLACHGKCGSSSAARCQQQATSAGQTAQATPKTTVR